MSEKTKKTLQIILISVLSLIVAIDTFFIVILFNCVSGMNEPLVPGYVSDMDRRISLLENKAASSVNPTGQLTEDSEPNVG